MVLNRERRQRGFVEPRQNQLLLPRVSIDIAHGEHTRERCLKLFGVDFERLGLPSSVICSSSAVTAAPSRT